MEETRCELDSHADTCCFGDQAMVLSQDLSKTCTVTGFSKKLGSERNIPICSMAVAFNDLASYRTVILIFHQALYIKNLTTHLLCPFQMRLNDIIVNDLPLAFAKRMDPQLHAIVIPSQRAGQDPLMIPLSLRGVISGFTVRKPTIEEINDPDRFPQYEMTYESPEYNPEENQYEMVETTIRESSVNDITPTRTDRNINLTETVINGESSSYEEDIFVAGMIASLRGSRRKGTVSPEALARKWGIGLETAKLTIEHSAQRAVRDYSSSSGTRRLKHSYHQLRYRHLRCTMYTDTLFGPKPSSRKNTCGQLFATDFAWSRFYPLRLERDAHSSLDLLHSHHGVPAVYTPDNAMALTGQEFSKKARQAGAIIHPIEAHTPNQNKAEANAREIKRMYRKAMRTSSAPLIYWDRCFELQCLIRSHTALSLPSLEGMSPEEKMTGDTPDISSLVEFGWWERVWYIEPTDAHERRHLGRWLGPSTTVGSAIASWVLTKKAQEIVRSSVFPLSQEDLQNPETQKKLKEYDEALKEKLRDRVNPIPDEEADDVPTYEPYQDDSTEPPEPIPEADNFGHEAYDKFISARVLLPAGDGMMQAIVRGRKRNEDGELIGKSHPNPILDTGLYEVVFQDGRVDTYAANVIAESIYEQIDEEGKAIAIMDEIVDHKKDATAISHENRFFEHNGRKYARWTTKGWSLCIKWKDGSTSWGKLRDMKESYPLQVAEYAEANQLLQEPAFAWWAPKSLRIRTRIIKVARARHSRYHKRNEKFGLELPKTVKRALEIDKETGTEFWRKALIKEMGNIEPCIDLIAEGQQPPPGYLEIRTNIVFDIKMDFMRKARFVADGSTTEVPSEHTFASVVSRDSVRIALLYAALNDLDILSADVAAAYLNAPCGEKVYFRCGPEFGNLEGQYAILTKALYGLKTSAAAWRNQLAQVLEQEMDFVACKADPNVWMRVGTKEATKEQFYEYLLVYTDDILVVLDKPKGVLTQLDQHFLLKRDSIKEPDLYLGSQVSKHRFGDDPSRVYWSLGSDKYIKDAVRQVKEWLKDRNGVLKSKAPSVFPSGYRPELDASDYCTEEDASFYHSHIGILRWAVELGRIDITTEVSMLAAFLAAPRVGHLHALLHIYAYLNTHERSKIVLDAREFEHPAAQEFDWTSYYPEVRELIPPNAPVPLGKPVQTTCHVDSDHAGDVVTRRSRTGILLYVNRAPILWYSKKQTSVETSTFGSEFVALKTATELIKGLRYKLRMMGIPILDATHVLVDNQLVVLNTSRPDSTLKKKSNSIAYHYVRESVAAKEIWIAFQRSEDNHADMLTKTQVGPERKRLAQKVLY